MNSADIKAYIALNVCTQPEVRMELEAHSIDDASAPRWKRTEKSKVKAEGLPNWTYLWDIFHANSGMLWVGDLTLETLKGCVARTFLWTPASEDDEGGDCCVGVVTNPADDEVVAWVVSVD